MSYCHSYFKITAWINENEDLKRLYQWFLEKHIQENTITKLPFNDILELRH